MASNSDAVTVALFCQSRCPANPLYGDRFHRLATSSSQVPTMNPSPIFILLFNRRQVGVARESRQMRLFRGGLPLPLQTALPRGPDRAVTRDLARMAKPSSHFWMGESLSSWRQRRQSSIGNKLKSPRMPGSFFAPLPRPS